MSSPSILSQAIQITRYGLPLLVLSHAPTLRAAELAYDADASKTLGTVEVVVKEPAYQVKRSQTATKTDTPLIDVPQSITVITDNLIRDQSMQNMADVVRYIPGVQMAQGEGHRDAPILRGNTSTADFFLNGVRDDVQYLRDLYNVERVEVLKGPSGMIFGRGGSGGLINRVTKQANWRPGGNVSLNFGSWEHRRMTADYNHVISDNAAFRVTGMYEDSESFRNFGYLERKAINPTMTLIASEATTISLGLEHFKDDRLTDRGVPSQLPLSNRPLNVDPATFFGSPFYSPASAQVDAFTALVQHDFSSGLKLANQTRIADYDKFYQNVFPGAYTAATGRVAISGYNTDTERRNIINQTDVTFTAQTGSVKHEFLIGLELSRQKTDNLRQTAYFPSVGVNATADFVTLQNPIYALPVAFRPSATDANNHSVAETAAVYVQDQIEFSPHWKAVIGARFDRFEAELENRRNSTTLDSSDDLFSPRAGLIFKPQENVSIYGSYTVAYVPRAGEQLASLTATNRNLDPEKFRNVELGAKWDFNTTLSATAALYRLDRTNVAIVDPNNPAQMILVDGQQVDGIEIGVTGQVSDSWQIMAGYAHQDSEVQTPGATDGNQLGQVPRNSYSLWNRFELSEQWGIGVGAVRRDDVFVSTDNAVVLPGFTRVDAAVFFKLSDHTKMQLNVENLFDREYFASAHSNNNIMPGSPRAFRVGLNFAF